MTTLVTACRGVGLGGAQALDDDELYLLVRQFRTVTALADHIGCSHSWLGRMLAERGLRQMRGHYEHPLRGGDRAVEKAGGLTIEDVRTEADDAIERLWAAADAALDAAEAIDTEQDVVRATANADLPIGIFAIGDVHIGSPGVDSRAVREIIDAVVGVDGLYVILNGDLIEGGLPGCPENLRTEQHLRVEWQRRLAQNIAERIAPHCIGVTGGQHEFFGQRAADFDFAANLAKAAQAPYLGPGGMFRLDVGGHVYSLACWHKYHGNSMYDATASAKRLCAEHGPFDVSIVADKHAPAASEEIRNGNVMRVFLRGGTLKLIDNYGKSLGYLNSAMQFPFVVLWPGERKLWRTGDLQEGLEYLSFLRR